MGFKEKIKIAIKKIWLKHNWNIQVKNAVAEAKKCALASSYYPEEKLKSKSDQIAENIAWAKKYGEPNRFYTLYGLDRVGSKPEDFMDYWHFMTSRNVVNRMGKIDSQLVVLRDKFMFYKYMKSCNLPVPEVFAIWKEGKLYDVDFNELKWKCL